MSKPLFPRSSFAITLAALTLPTLSEADEAVQTLPQIQVQATADAAPTDGYQGVGSRASTKTETPLLDTPQSVSVVTQQQIKDQAVLSLSDAVRYSPGVGFAQGEGNRDAVIIRGSTSTGDFYLDGVRDDVQYFRDLYNIDRVEILKGANGLAFGRGGSGGVVNRVTKKADGERVREFATSLSIENSRRASLDVGQSLSPNIDGRINLMTEKSDVFRDGAEIKRSGVTPGLGFKLGGNTRLHLDAEYFNDQRVADRGIPSRNGRPVDVDPDTFFGNAEQSPTEVEVRSVGAHLEHRFNSQLRISNRIRYADYDKYYQNVFVSGSANAAGVFNVQAYRDDTQRQNLFNQTDLVANFSTGGIRHTLVTGVEVGRQDSENQRLDGRFAAGCASAAKTTTASLSNPKATALAFDCLVRDSETQADVLSFYAQDQIQFSEQWQAVIGARRDQFDTDFDNILAGANSGQQKDREWAPRAALIFKPFAATTVYASYSKTFQPRAGDQLSSFDALTGALDPEQFINTELGLKWDVRPDLSLSLAAYRLDRDNIAVVDPSDPNRRVIIDGQRVQGVELSATGRLTTAWSLIGGYTYADSEITRNQLNTDGSVNIAAGNATAQTPEHSFSLWNRYDFNAQYGAAIGVISRSDMFAQDNNTVKLPGYARIDAALFYKPIETFDLQLNVENLGDSEYVVNAHNNNNITPGSPLSLRLSARLRF